MKPVEKTPVKTYFNRRTIPQNASLPTDNVVSNVNLLQREPLTTKKAVELLIEGTLRNRVCRYCLHVAFPLFGLDQILKIGGRGAMYDVTIRDMVASFHPFKVVDDPNFPNKICGKCLNQTIRSYLFAQQCEQSERAVRNCFDDMYEKLEKLDPLERVHKRGRQKLNPNHNKLYTEHEKVIDYAEPIRHLINSGSSLYSNEPAMSHLECKKCWQVLPNLESLANHEKAHPRTMWFNCRLCGQSYAKCIQLKKHLKNVHMMKNKLQLPESDDFECKECGFVTENHLMHLQHIEKHKFQMVLEHLIQRKMDKLCTVCLDKGGKLLDLDNIISLHGGYPELTGDRTLYNILGSTIPENQSIKYQELLIPCKANVLTITKRSKRMFEIRNQDDKSGMFFKLSCPRIISTDKIQNDDLYLFVFSEPCKIKEDSKNTNEDQMDIESDIQAACNKSYEDNHELTEKESNSRVETDLIEGNFDEKETVPNVLTNIGEGTTFDFSKPEYVNDVDDDESDKREIILVKDTYKTCWTFKKPLCEKYTDNTLKAEKEVKNNTYVKNTCNFCWIFKISGKCDFCKKSFQVDSTYAVNVPATHIDDTVKIKEVVRDTNDVIKEKNINRVQNITSASNPCKFCWVFKTIGKCDFCKNAFKVNTSTANNEHTANIDKNKITFVLESIHLVKAEKETNEFHLNIKKPFKSRKRKLSNDCSKVETKKTKWQCPICLINNGTNRQTCICCESNVFNDDSIKIKFGLNKNCFFNGAANTEKIDSTSLELQECYRNDIADRIKEVNSSLSESQEDQANIVEDNKSEFSKDTYFQNPVKVPEKIPEFIEITPGAEKAVTYLSSNDMTNSANNLNKITPFNFKTDANETMEIDEENNSYIKPAPTFSFANPNITFNPILQHTPSSYNITNPAPNYTNTFPKAQPTSFQFNIGSTPTEAKGKDSRKYLRAVKRSTGLNRNATN